jgi:hypothetical protein
MAEFRLILVNNPDVNSLEDFAELAQWIAAHDQRIEVIVCDDEPASSTLVCSSELPTVIFSPAPLRHFTPPRGALFQGQWLPKSAEYRRLESRGLPVPKWAQLTALDRPNLEGFGRYVVVKPELGARGADVYIARASHVQWRPPKTRLATTLGGPFAPYVVQRFVYTGPWPRSYRITTLFGEVLWSVMIEASHVHPALTDPSGFCAPDRGAGTTVVSSGKGCRFSLSALPDTLELAQRVHAAFPDIPLLGVDLLRDHATGELYIIEVNSAGLSWHFTSDSGLKVQSDFGFRLDSQFDGRRRAANILAAQTVRCAK